MKRTLLIGISAFALLFAAACGGPITPLIDDPDNPDNLNGEVPQPRPSLPSNFVPMQRVEGGTFRLGEDLGGGNPIDGFHQVRLTSFYIGRYPVTQEEYYEIMGYDDSRFVTEGRPGETPPAPAAP